MPTRWSGADNPWSQVRADAGRVPVLIGRQAALVERHQVGQVLGADLVPEPRGSVPQEGADPGELVREAAYRAGQAVRAVGDGRAHPTPLEDPGCPTSPRQSDADAVPTDPSPRTGADVDSLVSFANTVS
jgi:hypothetical protein